MFGVIRVNHCTNPKKTLVKAQAANQRLSLPPLSLVIAAISRIIGCVIGEVSVLEGSSPPNPRVLAESYGSKVGACSGAAERSITEVVRQGKRRFMSVSWLDD